MQTIAQGVHLLPIGSNAYLVDGDQGVTLVDTGLPGRLDAITDSLARIGRTIDDLTAICVTHAHVDHFGSAAAVRAASGAAVIASSIDAPVLRGEVPASPAPVARRLGPLAFVFRFVPDGDQVVVDHQVAEDTQGGLPDDLRVIDTPGHTKGHVSFLLDRGGGILFVGDAAMADRRGRIVRGVMNVPDATFDASIRHLATHDFTAALFGHGAPVTSGASTAFRRFGT